MTHAAERDGRALEPYITQITSASKAAETLGQLKGTLSEGVRPSAEMIEEARQALAWRAQHLGCERSEWLLNRYQRH
jgi:hypothetical protein